MFFVFFFFFQAEDGIRDGHVTGVQTCALPISRWWPTICASTPCGLRGEEMGPGSCWATQGATGPRSEERRVGKECRSRWGAYREKKKEEKKEVEEGMRQNEEVDRGEKRT